MGICGAIGFATGEFLFTHREKSMTTDLFLPLREQLVRRAKRTGRRIVLVINKRLALHVQTLLGRP